MATTHPATNHGTVEANGRDLEAVSREIASLKSSFLRLSDLLLQESSDGVAGTAREIADAGKGALARTEGKIRDWPLLSVLLCFLVGLVFGRLVLRK